VDRDVPLGKEATRILANRQSTDAGDAGPPIVAPSEEGSENKPFFRFWFIEPPC
jgi:hypothetical protein